MINLALDMSEQVLTEELLKELLSRPNVEEFIDEKDLQEQSFSDCLNELMGSKSLTKSDVIHSTNLNETHAYQMFSGQRGASRNKVLQIAFAMHLNLKETNKLLHSAGVSSLYCKDKRDAIIIFSIENNYTLQQIDEQLYKFQQETLSTE